MAKKSTGHPSRVPGRMKFFRKLEIDREIEKSKKKTTFKALNISKPDWFKQ